MQANNQESPPPNRAPREVGCPARPENRNTGERFQRNSTAERSGQSSAAERQVR
jgi:hypothetical protein